jgi:HSP20 family protein
MSEKGVTTAKTAITRPSRRERFDPLTELQDEMSRFWSSWPFSRPIRRSAGTDLTAWTPRIDMFEQNGNVIVKAELPGVKKEDIEVSVEDGELVISGERHEEHEVKEEHYYHMERASGSIYRRLPLPEHVDEEKIDAELADGVLIVTMPKTEVRTETPRKVTIK